MYLHPPLLLRLCLMMQRKIVPCFFILLLGVCTLTAQPVKVFANSEFASDEDEEPEMESFVSDEDEEPELEDDDLTIEVQDDAEDMHTSESEEDNDPEIKIVGVTPLNIEDFQQLQQPDSDMSTSQGDGTSVIQEAPEKPHSLPNNTPVRKKATKKRKKPRKQFGREFIEAPVIQLVHGFDHNGNERIEVARNRLVTNKQGKLTVLVDTSALREDMRENGYLQLAMRYRTNCNQATGRQPLTQKTASEPYADNMYVLTIDLCKQNANKVVFIDATGEKDLRSTASQIGSAISYLLLAKGYSSAFGAPDGDNGNFFQTTAATLPAAAVLQGLDQVTEYQEGSDELTGVAPCLTAIYTRGAMQLDRDFVADTGKLFTTVGVRHFPRSGGFTQWYKCMRLLAEDNLLYPVRNRYVDSANSQLSETDFLNMNETMQEDYYRQNNPHAARSSSVEFMSSLFTSVASTTLLVGADHYSSTRTSIRRLEKAGKGHLESMPYVGLELRGGAAASPYRSWETVDMGLSALSRPASFNELLISDVWSSTPSVKDALWELRYKGIQYGLMTSAWLYSGYRAYSVAINAKKLSSGHQMLDTGFLHAANWMELAGYLAMNEVKMQVTKPLVTMITDAAIEREILTKGSFWHGAANAGLQISFQFGLSMVGVEATRLAGNQFKLPTEAAAGAEALSDAAVTAAENSNVMIDILTGTTTNGMVMPLVLMLDEHLLIPIMDKGSAYFCHAYEWGIACPGHEVSLGVVVLPHAKADSDSISFPQVVYKKMSPQIPARGRQR